MYAAEIDNNILFAYAEFNTTTTTSNQFETYDINVSNIPVKNIAIGDIDIAYKIFGKGEYPLVLISGVLMLWRLGQHIF